MQFFKNKIWRVTAALLIMSVCLPAHLFSATKQKKEFVVVIDAGHGGKDVGAAENGAQEKDINLAVALKLGELIEKKLKDTKVVYTRKNDTFVSLQGRADIANKAKADLFISIHTNSVDKSNSNRANVVGASTYVLGLHKDSENLGVAKRENAVIELDANDKAKFTQFNPQEDESYIIFEMTQKKNLQNSIRFAKDVQTEMEKAGRKSRGVRQAGFWVLWSTAMPAALVELDFICNPEQAQFMTSNEGQAKLAGAIFNAVKKYEEYFRKSLGSASPVKNAVEDNAPAMASAKTVKATDPQPASNIPTAETPTAVATDPVKKTAGQQSSTRRGRRGAATSQEIQAPKTTVASAGGKKKAAEVTALEKQASVPAQTKNAPATPNFDEPTVLTAEEAGHSFALDTTPVKEKSKGKNVKKKSDAPKGKVPPAKVKARKQRIKTVYKIQLFTTEIELPADDEAFMGYTPISTIHENNLYKYTYGEGSNPKELQALLTELLAQFPDAEIIKCISD